MEGGRRMGFYVEPYKGKRDLSSATLSRGGGFGEMGEMEELFEQLMGGEAGEGLEDFDWEGLWDDFMQEEGGGREEQQGSYYPTMFGSPMGPGGFRRDTGQANRPLDMNYY